MTRKAVLARDPISKVCDDASTRVRPPSCAGGGDPYRLARARHCSPLPLRPNRDRERPKGKGGSTPWRVLVRTAPVAQCKENRSYRNDTEVQISLSTARLDASGGGPAAGGLLPQPGGSRASSQLEKRRCRPILPSVNPAKAAAISTLWEGGTFGVRELKQGNHRGSSVMEIAKIQPEIVEVLPPLPRELPMPPMPGWYPHGPATPFYSSTGCSCTSRPAHPSAATWEAANPRRTISTFSRDIASSRSPMASRASLGSR